MKRYFKKALALLVIISMIIPSMTFGAYASTELDIKGHWAEEIINQWIGKGLIKGYEDGTFKPERSITRAEFVTLVNRIFNFTDKSQIAFTDLKSSDFYWDAFAKAAAAGYIKGYDDGTVRPNNPISRQEAAVVLARVFEMRQEGSSGLNFVDAGNIASWSKQAIAALVGGGYISGYPDGTFRPAQAINRAETVKLINSMAGTVFNEDGVYSGLSLNNGVVNKAGVTLKNINVKGSLYLTEGIGEGDVVFDNVTVSGDVRIYGGGENSVVLNNSNINKVIVNKKNGRIRVAAAGNTTVNYVQLDSGAKLEENTEGNAEGFKKVYIASVVPEKTTIELSGVFEEVKVDALKEPQINLLKGKIGRLEINSMARLDLALGTTVEEAVVNVSKEIPVTGQGKVNKVVLGSEGAKITIVEQQMPNTGGSSSPSSPLQPKIIDGILYPAPPALNKEDMVRADYSIRFDESKWTSNHTHDGCIIKVGNWYYVFSTDYQVLADPTPGIQIRKSKDLIHWDFVGRVFESVSQETRDWTGNNIFWAPDVVKMNNKFYLYYCVSGIGTRNSYIGVATSDSIEGPWTDQGAVIKTSNSDDYTVNAIDPGIVFDRNGDPWMAYGSYFGGIYIVKLNKETGKLATEGDMGTLIAKRGDSPKNQPGLAMEGPAIIYNPDTDMFYLTVSYGWLEDTYNVRVARAADITGPYVDYNGRSMIDTSGSEETGNKIVGAYAFEYDSGWIGTGHNGLLKDGNSYYIIHNARVGHDKYWSNLHVRKILWTEDGWPVVSPERYAGETEQKVLARHIQGEWEQIVLDRLNNDKVSSSRINLLSNGRINTENSEDYWELTGDNTLKLYWYAPGSAPNDYWIDTLKVIPSWDWENWKPTLVFTGMNQSGTSIWGKKVVSISDTEAVLLAKDALYLGDTSNVKSNLTLPTTGIRGTTIVWTSSDETVVATDGTVKRPVFEEGDKTVTLSARITKGSAYATKRFNVTVLKKQQRKAIARYTFDGDNADDSSGNGLHGTVAEGVTWGTGKVGRAAVLDGVSGYIQLPNEVTDTEDYTVSAWVYWNGGGNWQRIFDFGNTGSGSWMFLTPKAGNGKLFFTIYKGTDQLLTWDALPENTWKHITITKEGNKGTLYVNGAKVATNDNMSFEPKQLSSNGNYLGKSRFPDPYFKGMIDEVEIYTYALTQDEIYQKIPEGERQQDPEPKEQPESQEYIFKYNGENRTANAYGNVTIENDSELGSVINLNGNGHVELPDDIISANMTVAGWVYWNGGANWQRIFDFNVTEAPDGDMFLTPKGPDDKVMFSIGKWGVGLSQIITQESFPIGQWTHVAVTIDGNVAKLYINGVEKGQNSNLAVTPNIIGAVNMYLGKSKYLADPLFNGKLARIEIFNRALTAGEIGELAQ